MSDPQLRTPLQDRLAGQGLAASMIVRLCDGPEIARLAATAGFDALYVDLEHSMLSLQATSRICMAARDAGLGALVRVPGLDGALICRVLDGGADGIIVPQVRSADDARLAVSLAMYPPTGTRSVSSQLPALDYRAIPASAATPALNRATLVAVMIETPEALAALDDIAATPGVGMLFIGAHDLAAAMGWRAPTDDAHLLDALRGVRAVAQRHGKALGLGGLASRPDWLRELAADGCGCLVSAGSDLAFLLAGAQRQATEVRSIRR